MGSSNDQLLDVLAEYFSAPIARLLLTITLQKLSLNAETLSPEAVASVVRALLEALPSYMSDPARRAQCTERLVALVPEGPRLRPSVPGLPSHATREIAIPVMHQAAQPAPARESKRPDASTTLPVRSAEDVVAVCDAVRGLTKRVGFPPIMQTKIATAVAELARNLQLYARDGEVCMGAIGVPPRGVEIVTTDQGPGIPNLDVVMGGTYRSRTGMGMGLRGARKLMDSFDISTSPLGTRVVVRKYLA